MEAGSALPQRWKWITLSGDMQTRPVSYVWYATSGNTIAGVATSPPVESRPHRRRPLTAKKYLTIRQWDALANRAERAALQEMCGFGRSYYSGYKAGRRTPVAPRAKEMQAASFLITPGRILGRLELLYPEEYDV
jgi:hypothetical protein|tara:strand:- start:4079 stop:4483 length:405 start_codon:yes stop_codon:yes gene_type:complete